MHDIHCQRCGGFMSYRKRLSYRLASASTARATANGGTCACIVPILDGPPPGFATLPTMPRSGGLRTSEYSSPPQIRKHSPR